MDSRPDSLTIKDRIVEVLAKYNVRLADVPLEMLAMAMERMIDNRLTSPLGEEVAKMLARWRKWFALPGPSKTVSHAECFLKEGAAALERLAKRVVYFDRLAGDYYSLFAKVHDRLTAPLPEEVAGLLASARNELDGVTFPDRRGALVRDLAAALERMARAQTADTIIARLRAENAEMRRTFGSHPLFQEKDRKIAEMLDLIKPIAGIPLLEDGIHLDHDTLLKPVASRLFTTDQVKQARAIVAKVVE